MNTQLFPKCRKLAYDARQQLAQVQNGVLYASELNISLDELDQRLDIMEQLVHRETPAQRQVWKRKILELRETGHTIRQQASRLDRMVHATTRHQKERQELLTRRRRGGRRKVSEEEQDLDNLADEAQSLQQSQTMVNELLLSGQASLNGLVDQRQRLRGVRRLVLDISNRLQLTNFTMRIIERRDITDAYLVLAGMVFICIVFYVVWLR